MISQFGASPIIFDFSKFNMVFNPEYNAVDLFLPLIEDFTLFFKLEMGSLINSPMSLNVKNLQIYFSLRMLIDDFGILLPNVNHFKWNLSQLYVNMNSAFIKWILNEAVSIGMVILNMFISFNLRNLINLAVGNMLGSFVNK